MLLNQRADGSSWWNECSLTPVPDGTGAVVQYIGIQTDVTERVTAERALATEQDRCSRYAARIAELDTRRGSADPARRAAQSSTDSPGDSRV